MADGTLGICVLSDGYLMKWQIEALENTLIECDAKITLVVVNNSKIEHSRKKKNIIEHSNPLNLDFLKMGYRTLRQERGWSLVLAERKIAWMLGNQPDFNQTTSTKDISFLNDIEHIYCDPISDGLWNELPDDTVRTIINSSDVVIRFGFGLLRGRILLEPEYGVLSFHPADVREYRGLSTEEAFIHKDESVSATLQQLNEHIDGGSIILIESTPIDPSSSYDEYRLKTFELQSRMLSEGIRKINESTFDPQPPEKLGDYVPLKKRRGFPYAARIAWQDVKNRIPI